MRDRVAVFIDGANCFAMGKALDLKIDYQPILDYFGKDLLRAYYYSAVLPSNGEFNSITPLLDWLDYNSFKLVKKDAKSFTDPDTGRVRIKGNMDIEIAVDALEIAEHVSRIVIFSGDGDFAYLVNALQRRGVHVTIVSTVKSKPPMCADELRRCADTFIDYADMFNKKRSRYVG